MPIVISGAPNQIVVLPLGLGSIIINEQMSTSQSDITVSALHIFVTPAGLANTDLAIASSHSDLNCAFIPSAGPVDVSGRVSDFDGRGISRASVVFRNSEGEGYSAVTNQLGFFTIRGVPSGETYFAEVSAKGYIFATQVVSVEDEIADISFIAEP